MAPLDSFPRVHDAIDDQLEDARSALDVVHVVTFAAAVIDGGRAG